MKLIIINGPPGVGKSTVAKRLYLEMAGAVLIDIDELRRSVPDYKERRKESLEISYRMAADDIRRGLSEGSDVIVDKGIMDSEVLDTLIGVGKAEGAEVHELLLFAGQDVVEKRAYDRGYKPGSLLTPQKVTELWERADRLRLVRSNAHLIRTDELTEEAVLNEIKSIVL